MPTYPEGFLTWPPVAQLYAVYAEREANRAKIAELEALLAGGEQPEEPTEPPPTQPYDDRVQVIWPAGLAQGPVESVVNAHNLSRVYAAVLAADVAHKSWGGPVIAKLKAAGCKVYAYVRAPVHARVGALRDYTVGIGAGSPFESAVYNLVKTKDAWVRDPSGKVMYHPSGYDAYLTPWLIAEEHARLVKQHVWATGVWDGILADGLTTNQIYAGSLADFDRDGTADVIKRGWFLVSDDQRQALYKWHDGLGGIPVIGNGSWEPGPETVAPIDRDWFPHLPGAYDEDLTHPIYLDGNENQQVPTLSQRWDMHRGCAEAWLAAGKAYWFGSGARLHNLERAQELRFTIATALLTGAKLVANEVHPWLQKTLGKPLAVPHVDGVWKRLFERGVVMVDTNLKDGSVTFR